MIAHENARNDHLFVKYSLIHPNVTKFAVLSETRFTAKCAAISAVLRVWGSVFFGLIQHFVVTFHRD
jgi:hypothetical protein